jgi:hypothetical protein
MCILRGSNQSPAADPGKAQCNPTATYTSFMGGTTRKYISPPCRAAVNLQPRCSRSHLPSAISPSSFALAALAAPHQPGHTEPLLSYVCPTRYPESLAARDNNDPLLGQTTSSTHLTVSSHQHRNCARSTHPLIICRISDNPEPSSCTVPPHCISSSQHHSTARLWNRHPRPTHHLSDTNPTFQRGRV